MTSIEVVTRPGEVGGASIVLKQSVVRGNEMLIEAEVRIAFVAGEKPQRIPAALRKALRGGRVMSICVLAIGA